MKFQFDLDDTILLNEPDGGFLDGKVKLSVRNLDYHLRKAVAKVGLFNIYDKGLNCLIRKNGSDWQKGKLIMNVEFIPDELPHQ